MKKVIICSVLSLFIGGIANASTTEVTAQKTTMHGTISLESQAEIIGSGVDEGGFFIILSTDTECVKMYISETGHGMFDH